MNEQDDEWDMEYRLSQMVEEGLLKERFDEKSNELVYSLEQKGIEEAENVLRTNRGARLLLIQVHMNLHGDFYEALLEMVKFMKKTFKINLFQDVVDAVKNNELEGIEIKMRKNSLNSMRKSERLKDVRMWGEVMHFQQKR